MSQSDNNIESSAPGDRTSRPRRLSIAKDFAAVVAVVITLVTFVKAVVEYENQGTHERAKYFFEMRHRFKDDEQFKRIARFLENNDDELLQLSLAEKVNYVGFFEEIALLTNSGQVRKPVAHYMFGYYAIQCWRNDKFWTGMNRDTSYWSLFRDFIRQMEAIQKDFEYKRYDFSF